MIAHRANTPRGPVASAAMGHPRSRHIGDRTASVLLLVLTGLLIMASAFMGLVVLAFLDYCPPESCSVDGAVSSVAVAIGTAAAVGIAGLVLTLVRLRSGRTGWRAAAATLVLCLLVIAGGGLAYASAVGA